MNSPITVLDPFGLLSCNDVQGARELAQIMADVEHPTHQYLLAGSLVSGGFFVGLAGGAGVVFGAVEFVPTFGISSILIVAGAAGLGTGLAGVLVGADVYADAIRNALPQKPAWFDIFSDIDLYGPAREHGGKSDPCESCPK